MTRYRTLGSILALAVAAAPVVRADQTVVCESQGHDHHYCAANTSGGVTLVRQMSHAGCWQGDTWGYDRNGIWVSNGCRAEFRLGTSGPDWARSMEHYRGSGDSDWSNRDDMNRWVDRQVDDVYRGDTQQHKASAGEVIGAVIAAGAIAAIAHEASKDDRGHSESWGSQDSWNHRTVTCESRGGAYQYCRIGWSQHVELERQLSSSPCRYNQTWGYDRSGIWVSDGCRGVFSIDGSGNGWSASGGHQDWGSSGDGVTLYRDLHFSGTSQTFEGDVADLRGSRVGNDEATSVRVSHRCRARLYEHPNYQGRYTEVSWDITDLRGSTVGDDAISSIRVRCN